MRIPSSFHSTDERSKPSTASPALAAVEASIGKIGRKISRPTSRRPSSPLVSASSAVWVRSPESMSARRASGPGTPAAFATASIISPASAPCLSSPVKSRLMKSASGSVARPSRLGEISLAPGCRARSRVPWTAAIARSRSAIVERRLVPRAALDPVDRRVADAHAALPRNAGEEADGRRHLVRLEPPQQLGEDRDLL